MKKSRTFLPALLAMSMLASGPSLAVPHMPPRPPGALHGVRPEIPSRPPGETFYFATGSAELTEAYRQRLADYARQRLARPKFRVGGHSDSCEVPTADNRPCLAIDGRVALAKKRAAAVRDELVKDGITSERIHVDKTTDPEIWSDPDGDAKNPFHRYVTLYDF